VTIPADHILAVTQALADKDRALSAIKVLQQRTDEPAALEGLIEATTPDRGHRIVSAAIDALADVDSPEVQACLIRALEAPQMSVRLRATETLSRRVAMAANDPVETAVVCSRRLSWDPAWLVRRAAVRILSNAAPLGDWSMLKAADDPHWRVRHALILALIDLEESVAAEADRRLAALQQNAPVRGVQSYLHYARQVRECAEQITVPAALPNPPNPCHEADWWDWDAAVLIRQWNALGAAQRDQQHRAAWLLKHDDPAVRLAAAKSLKQFAGPQEIATILNWLTEPRHGSVRDVRDVLDFLNLDRIEAAVDIIFSDASATPIQLAWAQEEWAKLTDEPETSQRRAACAAPPSDADLHHAQEQLTGAAVAVAPSASQRRADALTIDQAEHLMKHPVEETSWRVLTAAARMARTPLWEIEPDPPWRPAPSANTAAAPIVLPSAEVYQPQALGQGGLKVAPMGVSGHYLLPAEGFAMAFEAGVNLFFWEPNYSTLTEFYGRLAAADRRRIHLLMGTFEAEPKAIERDVDRALRMLQIEQVSMFLLFWVRSWARATDEVKATLQRMQQQGKIAAFGLSTHSRPLAIEAMQSGWNPIMVRHSAAHRGAEEAVLPAAQTSGVQVLTFNNLCYGRLLQPVGDSQPPTAVDCYRYSLNQPGVTSCWTAPGTIADLQHNLQAMTEPDLPAARKAAIEAHGALVYRDDTTFGQTVRSV